MCAICGCSGRMHKPLGDSKPGERIGYRPLADGRGPHEPQEGARSAQQDRQLHAVAADPGLYDARSAAGDAHLVALEADLLAKNDAVAQRVRGWLAAHDILALNLVSSPGSGKTTLLERTARDFGCAALSVLGGDQATQNDAKRIAATGCRVLQINTGTGCHLDADMVARALPQLAPPPRSVLMIENVGNLVCPALFDLGERAKVVMLAVTEGEDKPLKYPHIFRAATLMLLTKIDLLPHLDFDSEAAIAHARSINPELQVIRLSARSGEGFAEWCGWLRLQQRALHGSSVAPITGT